MKRHTNKNLKIFGSLVAILAMVAVLGSFAVPTWAADTKSAEADVEFTFEPTLTLEVSNEGTTNMGEVSAWQSKEADSFSVTVGTNNAKGFYLSATAGTKENGPDLKSSAGDAIRHLTPGDSNKSNVGELDDNSWGILVEKGVAAVSNGHYWGLPTDIGGSDMAAQAAAGTKLLDTDSADGDKSVDVKVGVKLGTIKPGTYQGQLNFYAVTKD